MAHPASAPPGAPALPVEEFPLDDGVIYLNHAAVGAMPRRTTRAIETFCDEAMRRPTVDYARWLAAERRLRERIARLLGGRDPADVSLTANTSQAISLVAGGFPWRDGDNVVLPAGEFPSNRLAWEALGRRGVELREISLRDATNPRALLDACDRRTRMVAASWVRYDSGERLDLAPLAEGCRRRGIRVLVDAIQGVGAVRMPAVRVDYVVGGAHKWMLGPEGVGYLWATPAARDQLEVMQFGWRMLESPFAFDAPDRRIVTDGRRFEPGTVNMLGFVALEASLGLLEEAGMDRIEAAIEMRVARLADAISARRDLAVVTPGRAADRAGILALELPGRPDAPPLVLRALQATGVQAAVRGGYLRLSPHAYTPLAALDETLARLDHAVAEL